jgi:hypothetical protein
VKIVVESRVLAQLIDIGLVIMDVGSPRLLVQAGCDALERSAGIDVTTDYHDARTGLPIREQCLPHRVLEGGFADYGTAMAQQLCDTGLK